MRPGIEDRYVASAELPRWRRALPVVSAATVAVGTTGVLLLYDVLTPTLRVSLGILAGVLTALATLRLQPR